MKRNLILVYFFWFVSAQLAEQSDPKLVTVPIKFDHNRIILDATITSRDGKRKQIRAWVDNGDPGLTITEGLARTIEQTEIKLQTGSVAFDNGTSLFLKNMRIELKNVPVSEIVPNMSSIGVEMNIPSSV